ncbi:MAG: 2-hydroxyglutaryl-CoA dehydratase [Lachnospiraceae bacterium]|nr:2-hydroxyglutaryl-CoA dehydratase [Lachnospiraceae bacterium]
MYTLGIDIGSASSKAVLLEDGQKIIASSVIQSGTGTSGQTKVVEILFQKAGIKRKDIICTVGTGYGRFSIDGADKQVSEITCHAKGVHFCLPKVRTIIDVGGQDAKAILLDENGLIASFAMNDKCAAGTGRFLEVMSKILEIPLSKMGDAHFRAEEWASVSSTCTVFAESEVISQLSKGVPKNNIVAGVHQSVASKACSLAYRNGIIEDVAVSGGVALNKGVVDAIEKQLGKKIFVAPDPQTIGALGAALIAYEEAALG